MRRYSRRVSLAVRTALDACVYDNLGSAVARGEGERVVWPPRGSGSVGAAVRYLKSGAAALIDRRVHHATMITLKGKSYRLRVRGLDITPAAQAPPLRGSA